MNCDHCRKACNQATNGPGVPAGEYWCDQCCRAQNVRVLRTYVWDGDRNRERWMAEQKAKKEARNARRVAYFLEHGEWPPRGWEVAA